MKNSQISIIAGPCSVDQNNIEEILRVAEITISDNNGVNRPAIGGTRVVGIKSRTELSENGGMGIDYTVLRKNYETLLNGGTIQDFELPPSVEYSQQILNNTKLSVTTEICVPHLQLPVLSTLKGDSGRVMVWNPAVEQLGWHTFEMGLFAKKNGWKVGIKNGKWVGETLEVSNTTSYTGCTTMEKTWVGLTKFTQMKTEELMLIHRGVDVENKGDYRNFPVHEIAKRVKKNTGIKLVFDPSHAYGPKMRKDIIPAIIEAAQMKISEHEYAYDGILVEVGNSSTDTDQHISISELEYLVGEVANIRTLSNI